MAVGLILVATACGDDDDDGAAATTTEGGGDQVSKLRITTLGLCNEIWYWADEKGIFADHNLEVEGVRTAGGAAGIAAIVSESADISFTNGYTSIISYAQGFPIRIIAGAYNTAIPPAPPANAMIVANDSAIQSVSDLAGKKVGVNELGGVNQIVTQAWLRKNSVDPGDVNFVALPFQELASSVVSGRLDAAQVPYTAIGAATGQVRSIGDPFSEGVGEVLLAGYLATADFLEENGDAVERFHSALQEAAEQLNADSSKPEQFEIAGARCNQDPTVLAAQPANPYAADVDLQMLEGMANTLVQERQIQEVPDLEGLVPAFARTT